MGIRRTRVVPLEGSPPRGTPLYHAVKQMILDRIAAGAWPPGHRVPSENELVAELGLSRMTINRALRELALEGALRRVQGLGTFVAEFRSGIDLVEIGSITDMIGKRGGRHSTNLVIHEEERATPDIADDLGIDLAAPVFHTILVHFDDELPAQIEDRYVSAALAPRYLEQDFLAVTPGAYLLRHTGLTEAEHTIDAILPAGWEAKMLGVGRADPCLLVRRRAFSGVNVVTAVRLLMPGGRFGIHSRMRSKA